MHEKRASNNGRIIAGILVIVFGIFLLLDNLNFIDSEFTPGFLVAAIGLIILINSKKKLLGVIILFIGMGIILGNIPGVNGGIIFPMLLILFGIYIVFRNRVGHNKPIIAGHAIHIKDPLAPNDPLAAPSNETFTNDANAQANFNQTKETINQDVLDEIAVFGGGHKTFNTANFMGGNITAVFGGFEIDLSNCKLASGENVLDVLAVFGGCEIIVPRDWNIVINVTPLFGGFSNKVRRDPNFVPDPSRVLVIKGLVMFGGGEIKSYKYD